jgi:hypothetical protein
MLPEPQSNDLPGGSREGEWSHKIPDRNRCFSPGRNGQMRHPREKLIDKVQIFSSKRGEVLRL